VKIFVPPTPGPGSIQIVVEAEEEEAEEAEEAEYFPLAPAFMGATWVVECMLHSPFSSNPHSIWPAWRHYATQIHHLGGRDLHRRRSPLQVRYSNAHDNV